MTQRTAFFLDIDNLAGTGQADEAIVLKVLAEFENTCSIGDDDLVFCAATARAAFSVKRARPRYRVAVGRGKDGSDRQLLSLADPGFLAKRFDRVVIGSGDSIFLRLVAELRSLGLNVELVVGRGYLATSLYRAVTPDSSGILSPITHLRLAA